MFDDPIDRRLIDGVSWGEFCRTLEQAGSVVLHGSAPTDPLDRAEGFR